MSQYKIKRGAQPYLKGGGSRTNYFQGDFGDVQFDKPTLTTYDEEGNPITEGNPNYNPEAPAHGTEKKFLGLIPYTAGKGLAAQINTQIAANAASGRANLPTTISEYSQKKDIDSIKAAEDLKTTLGIKQQSERADTEFKAGEMGRALYQIGQQGLDPSLTGLVNTTIPSPSVIPQQHDLATLSNIYHTLYGQNTQQGSIAGIPAANTSVLQSQSLAGKAENDIAKQGIERKIILNPEYQKAAEIGMIAEAGKPARIEVGSGQTVFDQAGGRQYMGMYPEQQIRMMGGVRDPKTGQMVGGEPVHTTIQHAPRSVGYDLNTGQIPTPPEVLIKAGVGQGETPQQPAPLLSQPRASTIQPSGIQDILDQFKAGTKKISGAPKMKNGKIEAQTKEEATDEQKKQQANDALKNIKKLLEPYNY